MFWSSAMNDDNDDLIRFASEILTVRDELDPRVFNRNGAVHEHLRLRMLDRADYLVKETVGMIDGLLTGDVVLLGSSASYFYRPGSDFDVKVEIINQNCPYLPKDTNGMDKFLALAGGEFYTRNKYFYIGNHFLDMKLAAYIMDVAWTGVYSLNENKWRIEPKNNLTKGFTVDSLIDYYHQRCAEIDAFMGSLPQKDGKYGKEECQKMFDYYRTQVLGRNQTIEDYLAFKLIKATRKLKNLGGFIFAQQMKIFDF